MLEKFISLIVASEYALNREAICKVLASEKDIRIVAQASSSNDVERIIKNQIKASILILDIDMVNLNLLKTLSLIKTKIPSLNVLLLTTKYDEKKIIQAICHGSLGYILNSADSSELIRSIRALMNGEVWIQRKMMAKVIYEFSFFIKAKSRERHF